jgi:hypothetical protein
MHYPPVAPALRARTSQRLVPTNQLGHGQNFMAGRASAHRIKTLMKENILI